jgi:hypothetical protein
MRRGVVALCSSMLLLLACHEGEGGDSGEDDSDVIDVQAILWCVLTGASGETASGEEVHVIPTGANRGACLCLPVGTQPYSGSELDQLLHEMAIDKCEEDLRALGAVTTNCEQLVSDNTVDYESPCDPDDWPPPP